jgi:hypothetical protein
VTSVPAEAPEHFEQNDTQGFRQVRPA